MLRRWSQQAVRILVTIINMLAWVYEKSDSVWKRHRCITGWIKAVTSLGRPDRLNRL